MTGLLYYCDKKRGERQVGAVCVCVCRLSRQTSNFNRYFLVSMLYVGDKI